MDKYTKGDVVEVSFDGIVIYDESPLGWVTIQFQRKDGIYVNVDVPKEFVMMKKNEFEKGLIEAEHKRF